MGPCGGDACDPLAQFCQVNAWVGGEGDAGHCVALPAGCPSSDPCPCLLPLCPPSECAASDGGYALLTCYPGFVRRSPSGARSLAP